MHAPPGRGTRGSGESSVSPVSYRADPFLTTTTGDSSPGAGRRYCGDAYEQRPLAQRDGERPARGNDLAVHLAGQFGAGPNLDPAGPVPVGGPASATPCLPTPRPRPGPAVGVLLP